MDDSASRSESHRSTRRPRMGFGLTRIRDPIEVAFGRYAHAIYRRPWVAILGVLLFVGVLVPQIRNVHIETSTEGMLPDDDPIIVSYDAFRDRYGRDQVVLIGIETDDIFDLEFLERLRALHLDLDENVPHLQDIESLLNTRDTRGEADGLVVGDLLDPWPESDEDLAFIRERVETNPLLVNQLISQSQRLTTLLVRPNVYSSLGSEGADALAGFEDEAAQSEQPPPYLTGQENTEVVRAVEEIVARHEGPGFDLYVTGQPVMVDVMMRAMMEDMATFTAASLLVIGLSLGLLFRRLAAVFLPLMVSGLAMLCTVSLMGIIGMPMTTTTQIMPSFLLAVGVGGAVHILAIFYQALANGDSKEDAIAYALSHSGLAVVMTSLTTAGGLLSFATADLAPIHDLGVITPIGILAALLFTLVLLPALMAVIPMSGRRGVEHREDSFVRRALIACGDYATQKPRFVAGIWLAILVWSLVGALQLELSHDPISWFPEDDPLRIALERLNDELAGMMYVETIIETGRAGAMKDPEMLARLSSIGDVALAETGSRAFITKVISIVDVAKETHRALNENRVEFYRVPQDPDLLAQEMLLFETSGADELEKLVDTQFSEARMTFKVPMVDAVHYDQVLTDLEAQAREILGDSGTLTFTGETRMMTRVLGLMTSNLIRTYILAFAIIAPLMILLLGSLRMGLISMIPNLAPILIILGIMGWFGLPLELFTLLIGSIALGLAVDDTVHFMHNFRRYYEHGADVREAVRQTLSTTGQALLFTTLVLSSGFFIYMLSSMSNLLNFGLLTGTTIVLAFLADLLFAPALMALLADRLAAGSPESEGDAEASSRTGVQPT